MRRGLGVRRPGRRKWNPPSMRWGKRTVISNLWLRMEKRKSPQWFIVMKSF
jgi:hypothetical protein